MKSVQISQELFFKLVGYHLLDRYEEEEVIKKGLTDKIDMFDIIDNPLWIMTLHIIIRGLSEGSARHSCCHIVIHIHHERRHMISYSLHISSKKHALTTTKKVAGASKHNLRQYESESYCEENILVLIGGDNILDDVKE